MRVLAIVFCLISFLTCFSQGHFEDWEVNNAGDVINSRHNDMFSMIMPDGLTLYFSSDRPGGFGDLDIYVSTRNSINEQWGEPKNLGPNINSLKSDHSVTVFENGKIMIYTSERQESIGIADLYISYSEDSNDPLSWGESTNGGSVINKESAWTACPLYVRDNNVDKIYFTSNRTGDGDVYASVFSNGQFESPVMLSGVNTEQGEMHFDPVEGFIWTNRTGGIGKDDIWITSNRTNEFEWTNATNLGETINTPSNEGMPSMTHDKSLFVFHSDRPTGLGNYDIYFALRKN